MKLTIKKEYDVTYSVQYFEDAEGGMDNITFQGYYSIETLVEAIQILEKARVYEKGKAWIITCDVSVKVDMTEKESRGE